MQHALLGLAIAFILAVAAALAAPAYVNWSDWRANFESHATTLAGVPVRIRGNIEAKLLPTPAFTFREVTVGNPGNGTGAEIGEVRGVLSLGSLLRGEFVAEEFILVRPEMRIAENSSDSILRDARGAAAAAGVVSLARLAIERGSLTVDHGTEKVVLDDIYAEGEVRARRGPMKIDGVFRRDGRRWGLRANAGQFSGDGTGRVRVTLEHAGAGRTFDAEGSLSLAGASPRFEGKVIATFNPPAAVAAGMNWQVTANTRASDEQVTLDAFQLTLGKDAAPHDLAGQLRLQPWRGGTIEGRLSARRLDLDTARGGDAGQGVAAAFAPLREPLALLESLPLRGRVAFTADAIAAGGGALRDVRAEFGLRENSLALERFEANLPGRGIAVASGSADGDSLFAGRASVQAEDAAAFVRWAMGGKAAPLRDAGPFRLAGRVDWRAEFLQVEALEFSLGETRLGGRLGFARAAGAKPARLEADLSADGANLDVLRPVADWLRGEVGKTDLALTMRGNGLRVLDRRLGRIDAALARSGEGVTVERLALEDFDGLSVRASGSIKTPIERPSGTIDFAVTTTRPDGLAVLVQEYLGDDAARLVRHAAGSGSPLKLAGKATGTGAAAVVEVKAEGMLGDMDAAVSANIDLSAEALAKAQMRLEARESKSLSVLFGLSPGLPAAGNGVLEFDLSKPEKGALPVEARLSVPGLEISANGSLRNSGEGRLAPDFMVDVNGGNLRHFLAVAAQAEGTHAIGAAGKFRLTRGGDGFQFRDISLKVGDANIGGALSASALHSPIVGGKLTVDRMNAPALLSLAVGSSRGGKAFWPGTPFTPAALASVEGAVDMEIGVLGLPGGRIADQTKLRLRLAPASAAIEDITGTFAGGRFAAHASLVRGQTVGFDGRIALSDFDAAQVIANGEGSSPVRGRGDLTLSLAGSGATPAAIAASLAGQGTVVLRRLEIDRANPDAIASVFAANGKSGPLDEISVIALLSPALAEGTLKIEKIEAPIVVAGGTARTVKARANAGETRVAAEASVDLARLTLDAAVDLEIDGPAGLPVRPGATLRWRGPLADIERGVEAAALANAINLRAMERETQRIEQRDRALPQRPQPQPSADSNPVASVPSISPPNPSAPPISILPAPRPKGTPPRVALPPLPPAVDVRPFPVWPPTNN